ncbi:MAG: SdpI family protein [Sphingobacteriaceae bacterium]|nr:MAG: SdpI family protein [Sphingobacteriaceae bacterium]
MDIQHWIIGPQLIGIILLLAGSVQKCYPPKTINPLYGYRTPSSTRNQQCWDEANCYSAKFMVKAGIILLLTGTAFSVTLSLFDIHENVSMAISGIVLVASAIITCVLLIVYTEKHLSKKFDT